MPGGQTGHDGMGICWQARHEHQRKHWSPLVKWQFNGLFNSVDGGATPSDSFILQARIQLAL